MNNVIYHYYYFRNEKIRTYNYPQDRITDHRVKLTTTGISTLMEGEQDLNNFIQSLLDMDKQERFRQWLSKVDISEDTLPTS